MATETETKDDKKSGKKEEILEFREEQKTEAQAQNLKSDNAVPEQRPQAFAEDPNEPSDLTKRLIEEGAIPGDKPMGKPAYDRAQKAAEGESEGRKPAVHASQV